MTGIFSQILLALCMVHCVIFYIYMYMTYTVCPKCITHKYLYGLDTYVNIRNIVLIDIIYVFTSYDYISNM